MFVLQFHVRPRGRDPRWVVGLANSFYGAYLDKEQALLDAVDAARDAMQRGAEAQVWLRESSVASRIF